jgi:hypothetical protein
MKRRLVFAILVMGFSGIVVQILLLREFLVVFSGNELAIGKTYPHRSKFLGGRSSNGP